MDTHPAASPFDSPRLNLASPRPLTQPLGFERYVKILSARTPRPVYPVVYLQVWLLALGLYMLGSHYVLMPGTGIALPQTPAQATLSSAYAPTLLTLVNQDMVLWQDRPYRIATLPRAPQENLRGQILLVQCRCQADIQSLLAVCHWAQAVGYESIHICEHICHEER